MGCVGYIKMLLFQAQKSNKPLLARKSALKSLPFSHLANLPLEVAINDQAKAVLSGMKETATTLNQGRK